MSLVMTLKELKFERLSDDSAEAYVQVSRIPDEQIIITLVINKGARSAYTIVMVSTLDGGDESRMFYTAANYAEAENIFNTI